MRTTLTLDDDVAALLNRLLKLRRMSLKELVNAALRRGLQELAAPERPAKNFQTKTANLGECLLPNMDCIGETLERLDEEESTVR
jgi:hypothetical protein